MPEANLKIEHLIHRTAVYSLESGRLALGLKRDTLRREVRLGRLRVAKRAGRYYVLGAWLLQWLEGGEVRRRRPAAAPASGRGVG
jgi:hypothetical protein